MKARNFFPLLIGSIVFGTVQAQTDCTVRKDLNGIKVFSCEVADSKFKSIKATFELDAELNQLVSVLQDVPAYNAWQYRMINPRLVRQDERSLTYYGEISAPWPVSNRDLIVILEFGYDPAEKVLNVSATGMPASLPLVENIIRIPDFKAKWTVRELANHQLQVEYNLVIDIGGAIPAWLINMAQAEGPFETFSNLKAHLKLEKYQGNTYSFLND